MKTGKTVLEWMQEYQVEQCGIDVRRFTSFGVIKVVEESLLRLQRLLSFALGFPPPGPQMASSSTGWPITPCLDGTQVFKFCGAKACSELLQLHVPGPSPTKHRPTHASTVLYSWSSTRSARPILPSPTATPPPRTGDDGDGRAETQRG